MVKNLIFFVLGLLICFSVSAQTEKEENDRRFDSIHFHTATGLAASNIERAFSVSDSLYRTSVSDLHKVKSLMLLSSLYQQKGEPEQAIIQAEKAERIAEKKKLYEWQARISGFLSTQYRFIGLLDKGKVYLDKGLKASDNFSDETQKNLYKGMVYQETTYYCLHNQELDKAEEMVKTAKKYFEKLPESPYKKYFEGTNYQLFGQVYLRQKKYDISLEYYQKALTLINSLAEDNILVKAFIYSGMGKAYLALEDYTKALEYLGKADTVAVSSKNINLQMEVYESFSGYYKAINNYEKYSLYRDKSFEVQKTYEINQKKYFNSIVKALEEDNQALSSRSSLLMIGIIVLLVLATGIYFYSVQKKKKDIQKFKLLIEKLTKEIEIVELPIIQDKTPKESLEETDMPKKTVNISEQKADEIIEKLREFERGESYLEKGFSLANLAGVTDSNTIYTSYVLNHRYNKDFNTYINELRIRYIVQKLKENKEYRTYKISYLAEECGFSSHSKFSHVFKNVTGFTPSVFINYLNQDKFEPEPQL